MAGYGIGRVLGGQAAGAAEPSLASDTSLSASLDTGERAATANESAVIPAQTIPLAPLRPEAVNPLRALNLRTELVIPPNCRPHQLTATVLAAPLRRSAGTQPLREPS
jgi:hypothetical protein